MTDQLRFAVRVVRWAPLAAVITVAIGIGAMLRVGDGNVSTQLSVAIVGAIAASVALSLDDPAHELLGAVPVGARRRTAQRVALVAPPAIVGWLLLGAFGGWPFDTGAGGIDASALVALIAVGIAVTVLAQHRRPDRAATIGASVALAWALSITFAHEGILADMSAAWIRHPWTVAALASAGAVLTTRR